MRKNALNTFEKKQLPLEVKTRKLNLTFYSPPHPPPHSNQPLILLSSPHVSLHHKAQTTNIQMVPISPNNNLSVSSVIVGACMQGQLHKEGLCVRAHV